MKTKFLAVILICLSTIQTSAWISKDEIAKSYAFKFNLQVMCMSTIKKPRPTRRPLSKPHRRVSRTSKLAKKSASNAVWTLSTFVPIPEPSKRVAFKA